MKANNYIIAITGGISSGKSTVAKIIENKAYKVIYYDIINRHILESPDVLKEISKNFGEDYIIDSKVDKKKLGELIFSDSAKREILNSIMHPKVIKYAAKLIDEYNENKPIFLEIPLIFQTLKLHRLNNIYPNEIWAVVSSEKARIERLVKRDRITEIEAKARIESNLSDKDMAKMSDIVIDNSSSLLELKKNIDLELKKLEERYSDFVQRYQKDS